VPASALSGGNQQKLIVAREFTRPVSLLIAAQPTRGVDVGSIEFIHKQIIRKRNEGCAVLVVSAELDEIIALSDRIAVMYRGKIVAMLDTDQATREVLGLLMAGCDLESCRHLLRDTGGTASPTTPEMP
jgi:simple sugar transport system ATP-binding protein